MTDATRRRVPSLANLKEGLDNRCRRGVTLKPEKELLLAVIDRAVLDYYGHSPTLQEEAQDWLFSDSDSAYEFSFTWICDYLQLDAFCVRQRITRLPLADSSAQSHRWLRIKALSAPRNHVDNNYMRA